MGEAAPLSDELDRQREDAEPVEGRLAELYTRHVPAGIRLAYLLTGDRQHAEDLAQDAFVRCIGRFRHLRVPDAFEAYLRRTIVNLHTSGLRRRRLERAWLAREGGRTGRDAATMPDVGTREVLWRQLLTLPPRQRAALVLRYYEDLSERETADVLGCSVPAVKSLTQRGAAAMRLEIESEER
jgi:RNA polymerase sigma-70 factor (sigma-E family)